MVNEMLDEALSSVEWKEFVVGELFDIQRGKRLVKREQKPGPIPYISSTALNNGVDNFIDPPKKMKRFKDCLTITNSGSVGTAFYHPYEFVASDHVTCMQNENLNEYNSRFIIPILNRFSEKYSFNREINNTRLKKEIIILPAKGDQPDWEFMEQFMKKAETQVKEQNAISFVPHEITDHRELNEVTWEEFTVEEIATVETGVDITADEREPGDLPYVSSSSVGNGISDFVGNENRSKAKNVISVNRNGSVGYAFYHEYEALFSNDVRRVTPHNNNKYSNLFLTQIIQNQKEKYSWGYKLGLERLKRQKILLPAKDGKPDWDFMAQYMMRMENKLMGKIEEEMGIVKDENRIETA